jgi:hypothetical protein
MTDTPQAAQDPFETPSPGGWFRKKWARNSALVLGTIAVLYGMVYVDVVSRAREAYMEGEKYMRWNEHPDEKKAELDALYEKSKANLDKDLAKKKIKKDEYDRQVEILQFDRERNLEESSLKYAYVWYKTAYELFSPPESKWVKLSRQKAPIAKEKWKEELRAKKIPFEEYMLE